jgi:hypothetical protein
VELQWQTVLKKRGYGKEIEKKEIKQEIVRAYCWLLAANYLDRYDSQNT